MSMYKDFIRESTSMSVHETVKYFFTYSFNGDVFWIKNLYVKPEYRGAVTKEVKQALFKLVLDYSPTIIMWESCKECPSFKKITYMSKALGANDKDINGEKTLFYINRNEFLARLK